MTRLGTARHNVLDPYSIRPVKHVSVLAVIGVSLDPGRLDPDPGPTHGGIRLR